jgi:hypothetical protein
MKKIALIVAATILWMGCGKGDDASEAGSGGKDSASAKKQKDDVNQKQPPATTPPELPAPKAKAKSATEGKLKPILTRGNTAANRPDQKTNGPADNHGTPTTAEAALMGSWTFKQGEFVYTIILEKEGHGKVRIATGDQKADFPVTWTADASNLTLTSKDEKTHAEDVDKGTYKLDGEHLKYDLEGEHFTFTRVKE